MSGFDEGKNLGICLVPFSFATKYGQSIMEKDNSGRDGKQRYGKKIVYALINGVSSITFLLYGMVSITTGSLDPTKWSEIQEQKYQQKIYQQNQQIKSSFDNTAGKDSVIDYKEFEKFYKEHFYNK